MKKKMLAGIMAFVMAVICVISLVPASYAKAEEKEASARQQLKIAIDLSEEIYYGTYSGSAKTYIKLFEYYAEIDAFEELSKAIENAQNVYDNEDLSDEDYLNMRLELLGKLDDFKQGLKQKEPDVETLSYLLERMNTLLRNADTTPDYEYATPASVWIDPDYYKQMREAFENAEKVLIEYYINMDPSTTESVVTKEVYDACVEMDKMYYYSVSGNTGLIRYKECTKDNVTWLIDVAQETLDTIKYYETEEAAVAAGAINYIIDKQCVDGLQTAIANSKKRLDEIKDDDLSESSYAQIYKYLDRAISRYNKKSIYKPADTNVDLLEFHLLCLIADSITDYNYVEPVVSPDGLSIGAAYVYYDDMDTFKKALEKAWNVYNAHKYDKDDTSYDFRTEANELIAAVNTINSKISYKAYTMDDFDATIDAMETFYKQLESMDTKEEINEYGLKGIYYATNDVKMELNAYIEMYKGIRDDLEKDFNQNPIETENDIAWEIDVMHANIMSIMRNVIIVNTNAEELNTLIKGAEDIVNTVYKSDDFDKVPAGELWLSPELISLLNKHIEIAKKAVESEEIDAMNEAYNALDKVRETANAFVKEGKAVVPTPDDEEVTDNNSSSEVVQNTETPKTADMVGIYVYVLMAALSAGIMGVVVCNRKVRR